jgi:hypothetical protein
MFQTEVPLESTTCFACLKTAVVHIAIGIKSIVCILVDSSDGHRRSVVNAGIV